MVSVIGIFIKLTQHYMSVVKLPAEAVPIMGRPILETETSQTPSLWPVYLRRGMQLMVGGPLRLDMMRLVCCRILFVWDLEIKECALLRILN